jgi:hypothetical protein
MFNTMYHVDSVMSQMRKIEARLMARSRHA